MKRKQLASMVRDLPENAPQRAILDELHNRPKPFDAMKRFANGMNKTEAKYADKLAIEHGLREIEDWKWCGKDRSESFLIGKRRRYTPDFKKWLNDGRMEVIEIKGYLRDGGSIRFDLAAEANPQYVFRMLRRTKDGWEQIRVRNEGEQR
jgi:hypothetical protein